MSRFPNPYIPTNQPIVPNPRNQGPFSPFQTHGVDAPLPSATNFHQQVLAWVGKTKAKGQKVMHLLAQDVYKFVTDDAPIWTGRYRANWNVGINSPDLWWDWNRYDYVSENALEYAKIANAKWGDSIWITNNIHYSYDLENGTPQSWHRVPTYSLRIGFAQMVSNLPRYVASIP
jgi:hypothetical protein